MFSNPADTSIIRSHLTKITRTTAPRNSLNPLILNQVAEYIYDEFSKYADTTYYQSYLVNSVEYRNVICVFGSKNEQSIIIGAHYDVCGDQEGADDNASGTVGLLETARLLKDKALNYRIELVAYTLEEPPYFRTEQMGSYVHAKSLVDDTTNVYGMICLEMIGYFSEEKKSQTYPIKILSLFYGNRGNYITVVNKLKKGKFSRKYSRKFKKGATLRTKKFTGPKTLQGIDFSDHLNYWKMGISSLMITDTAFYRNKNYHRKGDSMETLDIAKMAQVIDSVVLGITSLK